MIIGKLQNLDIAPGDEHVETCWEVARDEAMSMDKETVYTTKKEELEAYVFKNIVVKGDVTYYGRAKYRTVQRGWSDWNNLDIINVADVEELGGINVLPSRLGIPRVDTYLYDLNVNTKVQTVGESLPNANHPVIGFCIVNEGYSSITGSEHIATSYYLEDFNRKIIWKSEYNTLDLHKKKVEFISLEMNKVYRVRVIHHSSTNDVSDAGCKTFITGKEKNIALKILLKRSLILSGIKDYSQAVQIDVPFELRETNALIKIVEFGRYGYREILDVNIPRKNPKYTIPANTMKNGSYYMVMYKTWQYKDGITPDPAGPLDNELNKDDIWEFFPLSTFGLAGINPPQTTYKNYPPAHEKFFIHPREYWEQYSANIWLQSKGNTNDHLGILNAFVRGPDDNKDPAKYLPVVQQYGLFNNTHYPFIGLYAVEKNRNPVGSKQWTWLDYLYKYSNKGIGKDANGMDTISNGTGDFSGVDFMCMPLEMIAHLGRSRNPDGTYSYKSKTLLVQFNVEKSIQTIKADGTKMSPIISLMFAKTNRTWLDTTDQDYRPTTIEDLEIEPNSIKRICTLWEDFRCNEEQSCNHDSTKANERLDLLSQSFDFWFEISTHPDGKFDVYIIYNNKQNQTQNVIKVRDGSYEDGKMMVLGWYNPENNADGTGFKMNTIAFHKAQYRPKPQQPAPQPPVTPAPPTNPTPTPPPVNQVATGIDLTKNTWYTGKLFTNQTYTEANKPNDIIIDSRAFKESFKLRPAGVTTTPFILSQLELNTIKDRTTPLMIACPEAWTNGNINTSLSIPTNSLLELDGDYVRYKSSNSNNKRQLVCVPIRRLIPSAMVEQIKNGVPGFQYTINITIAIENIEPMNDKIKAYEHQSMIALVKPDRRKTNATTNGNKEFLPESFSDLARYVKSYLAGMETKEVNPEDGILLLGITPNGVLKTAYGIPGGTVSSTNNPSGHTDENTRLEYIFNKDNNTANKRDHFTIRLIMESKAPNGTGTNFLFRVECYKHNLSATGHASDVISVVNFQPFFELVNNDYFMDIALLFNFYYRKFSIKSIKISSNDIFK